MSKKIVEIDPKTINYAVATSALVVTRVTLQIEQCTLCLPPDQKHAWELHHYDVFQGQSAWRCKTIDGIPCGSDGQPLYKTREEALGDLLGVQQEETVPGETPGGGGPEPKMHPGGGHRAVETGTRDTDGTGGDD